MRRAMIPALLLALLPGVTRATDTTWPPPEVAEIARRADRLPAVSDLGGILPNLGCAASDVARHLEPLPVAIAWTRAPAIVVREGLPDQPEGARAVLLRATRELRARVAVQQMVRDGTAQLYRPDLRPAGPQDREAPFLALFVDEPPPADHPCLAPGR